MNIDSDEKSIFIASDDFILKENQHVQLFKYYDPLNDQYITFISSSGNFDKEMFISIKQENFKSAFIGNIVLPAPIMLYVKKFNPLILIIGLITLASNRSKSNDEEIDYATILNVYSEEVKKGQRINENECISFVRKVLYGNVDKLGLLCNVKKNDVFDDDLSFKFRLLKSKVYDFLNSKINIDNEQLSNLSNAKESEIEEIKRRMIKERFEVLFKFMPKDLMIEYANDKNIKVSKASLNKEEKKDKNDVQKRIEETIQPTEKKSNEWKNTGKRKIDRSITDDNNNSDNNTDVDKSGKRKANTSIADIITNPSYDQKKKKATKKPAKEINIDQGNLNAFFTKK